VVAALYFGHALFVPLALAILLSFILAPVVVVLRRWRFGRVFSVVLSVLLAVAIFATLGTIVTMQVTRLAGDLPRYEYTIRDKVQRAQAAFSGPGVFGNASSVLKGVSKELDKPSEEQKAEAEQQAAPEPAPQKPMPVEVHQPPPSAVERLNDVIGPLLQPLAVAGIVLVFVVFILLQREDLRDRIIRLFGTRDLQRSTAALNDAAYRLSRYFLTQLALNTAFGAVICVGLFVIGVPNAILWGMVAALMRFVPYVGGFIAAGGPTLLALAVDPGWSMALWTLALFAFTEPFMGQVVEPWVYGHSTGVSSLAIIVAATFWTLLWGPIGLLLSTPLTVCLVVLGRHVQQLQFLDVLLGDKPALAPEQTFYHRLLAGDPIEIADQAEACLQTKSLLGYYDDVVIKGLVLAQKDVRDGLLDADAQARIIRTVGEVIEDLDEYADAAPAEPAKNESAGEQPPESRPPPPTLQPDQLRPGWEADAAVLCVGGTNALDSAAAAVLAQLLRKHGIGARVVAADGSAAEADLKSARMVCLSFLEPSSENAARFLIRRMRRRIGEVPVLAVFWGRADLATDQFAKLIAVDGIVSSADEAVGAIVERARRPAPETEHAAQ
jgi:predicted PurR-regulated permease PerM